MGATQASTNAIAPFQRAIKRAQVTTCEFITAPTLARFWRASQHLDTALTIGLAAAGIAPDDVPALAEHARAQIASTQEPIGSKLVGAAREDDRHG